MQQYVYRKLFNKIMLNFKVKDFHKCTTFLVCFYYSLICMNFFANYIVYYELFTFWVIFNSVSIITVYVLITLVLIHVYHSIKSITSQVQAHKALFILIL